MITQVMLKRYLHYSPGTGLFTWKPRDLFEFKSQRIGKGWNTKYANNNAGSIYTDRWGKRYIHIKLAGKVRKAHRLAFLYMTGKNPSSIMDHNDGDGTNNKWLNISSVSYSENNKNMRQRSDNTSGFTGVHWSKSTNKWKSAINTNNKRHVLGYYEDISDAVNARKIAERELGFKSGHGSRRPL